MTIEKIDRSCCTNCGQCYNICPMDVFGKIDRQTFIANPEDCMSCYLCEIECPGGAIHVNGKRGREIPFPY